MQPKFVAQKNVVKTETCANIRKWIARFIILGIYTRQKRVCIAHIMYELPIDMGNSICTVN